MNLDRLKFSIVAIMTLNAAVSFLLARAGHVGSHWQDLDHEQPHCATRVVANKSGGSCHSVTNE